jgi:hypothetical protein
MTRAGQRSFAIEAPAGWEAVDGVEGMALVLREPGEPSSGFRANVTVTAEPAPQPDVEAYTDAALAAQDELLEGHRTIDRTADRLGEAAGTRTLGHHAHAGHAVVIGQWRVLDAGVGWTVTASCAALDYAGLADALDACAESFRVEAAA